jgi:hypothetical protein
MTDAFKQKMYLAKLYADKLDTLASERFTIINTLSLDNLLEDPLSMLKGILKGEFMYCYRGYSCGFSLYDATYLASMIASMVFLKEAAAEYSAYDASLSSMFGEYYQSSMQYGARTSEYLTMSCTSCQYGDSWFNYNYASLVYESNTRNLVQYYYQYAASLSYPISMTTYSDTKSLKAIFTKIMQCDIHLDGYAYDRCPPTLVCTEECTNRFMLSDGNCDDGGPGSEFTTSGGLYGFCEPGSDCEDCGDRWLVYNPETEYIDFCDNIKGCAQSFGSLGTGVAFKPPPSPPPPAGPGRRLESSSLSASGMTVIYDTFSTKYTDCFDLFTMDLNGTTPKKYLHKWVTNRANLSVVVGLYDSCYLCEDFLTKMLDKNFGELAIAAVSLIKVFYYVYKPTLVLPLMPHCDNDFESMALKHAIAFDKSGRLTDEVCPYMPKYLEDQVDKEAFRDQAKTFLKTLYRLSEIMMGKDLF